MYNSQKCIIFASNLKNGTKLLKKIHINKLKFKNYENKCKNGTYLQRRKKRCNKL